MTGVASFYKALLLSSEAYCLSQLADQVVPTVLTLYNSCYHLALSHLLAQSAPPSNSDWVRKIRTAIQNRDDIGKVVRHSWLDTHLSECAQQRRMVQFATAFSEMRKLRDDLQYGPRVRRETDWFVLDSCKNPAPTIRRTTRRHLEAWDTYVGELLDDTPSGIVLLSLALRDDYRRSLLKESTGLAPYYSKAAVARANESIKALTKNLWPNRPE